MSWSAGTTVPIEKAALKSVAFEPRFFTADERDANAVVEIETARLAAIELAQSLPDPVSVLIAGYGDTVTVMVIHTQTAVRELPRAEAGS